MKKILSLLTVFIVLLSCKDGVLEVPAFTFDTAIHECGTYTLHRRNADNTKAIVLTLQADDLPNTVGVTNLSSSGRSVLYRIFDGAISDSYFCGAIPPATPRVIEEWNGNAFSVKIDTQEDTTTTPTSYVHTITLEDLVIERDGVQEIFQEFYFGIVVTE